MRMQDHTRMSRRSLFPVILICLTFGILMVGPAGAAEPVATLRMTDLSASPKAPAMPPVENKDLRRMRNYPEQPPTIPHKTRGYQIDLNGNKCLTCHSRKTAAEAQAPMVSVTHFMDGEGQVRAFVTGRRYFCNQCHVPQLETKPLIGTSFEEVESVVKRTRGKTGR